jgi:hypothetical protein
LTRLPVLALFLCLPLARASDQTDPWARIAFLVGEWEGVGSGSPGQAIGGTTFGFELGRKVLVRRNWAKYPPRPGESQGTDHEDLMIVYPAGGGVSLRAAYFDNEGHVIFYKTSFPADGEGVIFESEPGPGPRFRLAYERRPDGSLENVFSVAAPGEEFKVYARGLLKRKG